MAPDAARTALALPSAGDDVWQRAIELVRLRQYQQAASLLEQAWELPTAVPREVLSAARQICLACDRFLQETRLLKHASELAADQERELQGNLVVILHQTLTQLGLPPAPLPSITAPETTEMERAPGLWQRLHRFMGAREGHTPQGYEPAADAHSVLVTPARPDKERDDAPPRPPAILAFCLGQFRFYDGERAIVAWPNRRSKAVLKFLLLHREHPVRKDVLMDAFWPDHEPSAARNNLNVAIYTLRQALRNGHAGPSTITFQDESYAINPELDVWLDVEEFQRRTSAATRAMRRGHLPEAVREYEMAVELYQGDLLEEDAYEPWIEPPRRALRESYVNALNFLAGYSYEAGHDAACVGYGRKLLAAEPADEAVHRRLMRVYARQNQRYLAIRQYQQCVEALREHLDVDPDPATTRLYEAILHNTSLPDVA